jgi:hypothetical protein
MSEQLTQVQIEMEAKRIAINRVRKALVKHGKIGWFAKADVDALAQSIMDNDRKLRTQARRNLERRVLHLFEPPRKRK